MLTIKVKGYKEAKEILDGLPNNMQKSILLSALRQSAKPMLTSARNKVHVKSGKLKKQLRIVRYKDRGGSKTEAAVAVKPVFDKSKKSVAINQWEDGAPNHHLRCCPRRSRAFEAVNHRRWQNSSSRNCTRCQLALQLPMRAIVLSLFEEL